MFEGDGEGCVSFIIMFRIKSACMLKKGWRREGRVERVNCKRVGGAEGEGGVRRQEVPA